MTLSDWVKKVESFKFYVGLDEDRNDGYTNTEVLEKFEEENKRPFIEGLANDWLSGLSGHIDYVLNEKDYFIDKSRFGQEAQDVFDDCIWRVYWTQGASIGADWEPLKKSTIRNKRRRKVERPEMALVDSGQLIKSFRVIME